MKSILAVIDNAPAVSAGFLGDNRQTELILKNVRYNGYECDNVTCMISHINEFK